MNHATRPTIHVRLPATTLALLCMIMFGTALADRRDPVASAKPKLMGFEIGEEFALECRNATTGAWSDGPVCTETGKPMSFTFGVDRFLYCGLEIADEAFYAYLVKLLSLDMPVIFLRNT